MDAANSMVDEGQHQLVESEIENRSNESKLDPGRGSLSEKMSIDHMRTEKQLMKEATKAAESADSRNGDKNQAEGGTVHREMDASTGTNDGKEKEREVHIQNKKSGKIQTSGIDKAAKGEREENGIKKSLEVGYHQNTCAFSPQIESEVEDGENGLIIEKTKPKKKKGKFQA